MMMNPKAIIPGTTNNMTGTAVVTSLVIDTRFEAMVSFQAVWTGTPNGTFSLQASLTYVPNPAGGVFTAGTWTDTGIGLPAAVGAAGDFIVDMALTSYPFLRMVYTNTSSTGSLTVTAMAKG